MVQVLLSLETVPRPDHAADALAIAICHASGAPHAAAVADSTVLGPPAQRDPEQFDELDEIDASSNVEDIHVYRRQA